MDILLEEVMKGHTAPHTVAIRNSEGLFVHEDWMAQIELHEDQSIESQRKSFRILFQMNKQEQTMLSKWPLSGILLAVES